MNHSHRDTVIDTTTAHPIKDVTDMVVTGRQGDPAIAVTVALANELQTIYAKDHSKLQAANRTLKAAIKSPQS